MKEAAEWEKTRNAVVKVDWQFTTADAASNSRSLSDPVGCDHQLISAIPPGSRTESFLQLPFRLADRAGVTGQQQLHRLDRLPFVEAELHFGTVFVGVDVLDRRRDAPV